MTTLTPEERDDIAERYAFAEGEREAIAAELAERQQRIAHAEAVAWCKQYNAQRQAAERAAAEQSPPEDRKPSQRERSAMTDWAAIDRRIRDARKASEDGILHATADAIHAERQAARKQIAELRTSIAELTARLDKIEQAERSAVTPFLRTVS